MDVIVSKWMFFPFLSPNGCFREKLSTNGFSPIINTSNKNIGVGGVCGQVSGNNKQINNI